MAEELNLGAALLGSTDPVAKGKPAAMGSGSVEEIMKRVAYDPRNQAEDLVPDTKLGYHLVLAVAKKGTVEPEAREARFETGKYPKKRHGRFQVVEVKQARYGNQVVEVKVLDLGQEYYTGKSIPSGLPSHGTNTRDEASYKAREIQRLENYIRGRQEAAHETEFESGRTRKGGLAEDWEEALGNLSALRTQAKDAGVELTEDLTK